MKLGIVSAIYDGFTFEEAVENAVKNGCECMEVACWPQGKAERRYAGVSHIDVENTSPEYIRYILDHCRKSSVTISSLAFYPNNMDGDLEKRNANNEHLKKVIRMSSLLGVNLVTTFIGRDQTRSVEENLELVKEIWPPILEYAKNLGVRVAIENCPMLFGKDQWPGGQNLFTTPDLWNRIFDILPYENLGINYDPSHFIWQHIDYLKPVYTFRDRIFHVHFKDIKLYKDRLDEVGIMAYPLQYMSPKLPGLGDVNWGSFVSALKDVGYDGFACIEIEDRAFENSREDILKSVELSCRYMRQFVI
ncbi:MAG: sugar phosphate isomerase/epimerase [Lachnospiraceae bacterium]|nr:sugar phosphate isomerase/epimerase [Lachnospiraceae bacterium]